MWRHLIRKWSVIICSIINNRVTCCTLSLTGGSCFQRPNSDTAYYQIYLKFTKVTELPLGFSHFLQFLSLLFYLSVPQFCCTLQSQSSTVLHLNPFPTAPSQSPHRYSSVEAKHETQHLDISTEWRRSVLQNVQGLQNVRASWEAKLSPFQQFCKIGGWQRNLKTLESGSYITAVGNGSLFFLMFIITDNTIRNSRDLPS